jgi:hypothetical protein
VVEAGGDRAGNVLIYIKGSRKGDLRDVADFLAREMIADGRAVPAAYQQYHGPNWPALGEEVYDDQTYVVRVPGEDLTRGARPPSEDVGTPTRGRSIPGAQYA